MNIAAAIHKKGHKESLNPCFRGLSHELKTKILASGLSVCLNPCFRGLSHE